MLPYTLVAALIHDGNPSAEGALTGLWTATEKLGLALGPTITGLALWLTGREGHALPLITITASGLLMVGSIAALRRLEASR